MHVPLTLAYMTKGKSLPAQSLVSSGPTLQILKYRKDTTEM